MPIYDYRCRSCGATWEVTLRHAADSPAACPHCGGGDLERLVSAPYVLKGGTKSGRSCCGREERCATPPCAAGNVCQRR